MPDLAGLTPTESHKAGVSVLVALGVRREAARAKAVDALAVGMNTVAALHQARADALGEAIALIEPTATIGRRSDTPSGVSASAPGTSDGVAATETVPASQDRDGVTGQRHGPQGDAR